MSATDALTPKIIRMLLVIFIAGIGLGTYWGDIKAAQAALILSACLLSSTFVIPKHFKYKKIISLSLLVLIASFTRTAFINQSIDVPEEFEAEVLSDTQPTTYGAVTAVKGININLRLKVWTDRYPEFQTGDKVLVSVDEVKEEYRGYASGSIDLLQRGEGSYLRQGLAFVKRKFIQGVSIVLPEPHASFVAGTVVGGSAGLPQDLKDAFTTSGISHILAASGYNFSLLLFFFGFLLYSLAIKKKILIFLLIIPSFAIIAGGSPPVLRAALMAGLASSAVFSGRISTAKTALLWAAVLMLLFDPSLLNFSVGFQLSLLATLGLILVLPFLEKYFSLDLSSDVDSIGRRLKDAFMGSTFATLAAQITTIPIIAYTFGTISLVSFPVNLMVILFIPAIMILGIVSSLMGLIMPFLGQVIALPAWLLSEYVFTISRTFSNFSYSQIFVEVGSIQLWLVYVVLGLIVLYLNKKYFRHKYGKNSKFKIKESKLELKTQK